MNAKKWLSMVLILSFVLVLCPMLTPVHAEEVSGATPAADSAPNTPNEFTGEAVTDGFQGGDGTAENPYQIATLAQLQYFANYVNEGNTPADGAMQHFALTHDIVVNESFTQWVFGTNPSKIATADNVPFIGTETAPFYGHFDGNGKTIFGYYRNTQLANSGLFGWGKGVIENLNMDTLYMTTGAQSSALLSIATGDITIRNCSVTNAFILSKGTCGGILGYGNAVGSTIVIDGCTYQGKINGNLNYSGIGGIMQSYIHSVKSVSITNCHTNADLVNSQWDGASGILHTANYTTDNPGVLISDCTFRGSIQSGCYKSVGGILANANNAYRIPNTSTDVMSDIIIQNCVNYGTLYANAQGVAGGICATVSGKSPLTVENCYNFGTLSANASNSYTLAGIVGDASANSTLEMANCANYGDIVAKAAAPTLVAGGLIGKQQPGWPSANICIYNCANYGTLTSESSTQTMGQIFGVLKNSSDKNTSVKNIIVAGAIVPCTTSTTDEATGVTTTTTTTYGAIAGQLVLTKQLVTMHDTYYLNGTNPFGVYQYNKVNVDELAADDANKVWLDANIVATGVDSFHSDLIAILNSTTEFVNPRTKTTTQLLKWYMGNHNDATVPMFSDAHIAGASISLAQNLAINFYVDAGVLAGYHEVTLGFGCQEMAFVNLGAKVIDGKSYLHYQVAGILPATLDQKLSLTLSVNGYEVDDTTYSVLDYVINKYDAQKGNTPLNNLVLSILHYGNAAQNVAGNATMLEQFKAVHTDYTTETADYVSSHYDAETLRPATITSIDGLLQNLGLLADGIVPKFQVPAKVGGVDVAQVKVEFPKHELLVTDIPEDRIITTDVLSATALNTILTLTLMDAEGNELASTHWAISNFILAMDDNATYGELAQALAVYMQASRAYAGLAD